MLHCVRFHKRHPGPPGSPCRSVQGGITIFRHAACLEIQGRGSEYREGGESYLKAQVKVTGQPQPRLLMITELVLLIMTEEKMQSIYTFVSNNEVLLNFIERNSCIQLFFIYLMFPLFFCH